MQKKNCPALIMFFYDKNDCRYAHAVMNIYYWLHARNWRVSRVVVWYSIRILFTPKNQSYLLDWTILHNHPMLYFVSAHEQIIIQLVTSPFFLAVTNTRVFHVTKCQQYGNGLWSLIVLMNETYRSGLYGNVFKIHIH